MKDPLLKCPRCQAELYHAISGQAICANCGYGSSYIKQVSAEEPENFLDNLAIGQSRTELERLAYHEAGHAVTAYVLRKGHTNKLTIPLDMFEKVTLQDELTDWGRFTPSLDSLLSAVQVLLGGYVSEKIQYALAEVKWLLSNNASRELQTARHLIRSLLQELNGDNFDLDGKWEQEIYEERLTMTETLLRQNWVAVEALTQALLQQNTLTGDEVVQIIETAKKA